MTDQPQDKSEQSESGRDVTDLRFPLQDSEAVAIHECRMFYPDGRLKRTIRERTVGEEAALPLPPLIFGGSDFKLKGKSFDAD